jgi:hypothetical protein
MTELEGYLLKCVLERLEKKEKAEGLTELCACSFGIELTPKGEK